jgi:adenosylhomocysteine nucleosidase
MWRLTLLVLLPSLLASAEEARIAIMVSANAEWRVVRELNPRQSMARSPYGEFFLNRIAGILVVVLHGGWGKVEAAASVQYAIDRWKPEVILNLGTCGRVAGQIEKYDIVLANRTVIYDIVEMMGDSSEAIRDYTAAIDLTWLGPKLPSPVRRATLVSADSDLSPAAIPKLRRLYGAVAADWESGAIARVAARSGKRVVILRGVGEALPAWITAIMAAPLV